MDSNLGLGVEELSLEVDLQPLVRDGDGDEGVRVGLALALRPGGALLQRWGQTRRFRRCGRVGGEALLGAALSLFPHLKVLFQLQRDGRKGVKRQRGMSDCQSSGNPVYFLEKTAECSGGNVENYSARGGKEGKVAKNVTARRSDFYRGSR